MAPLKVLGLGGDFVVARVKTPKDEMEILTREELRDLQTERDGIGREFGAARI